MNFGSKNWGIFFAFGAAFLFGLAPVICKPILEEISPVALAGFLYLGAGIGLTGIYFLWRRKVSIPYSRWTTRQKMKFMAAIVSGGVLAPFAFCTGIKSGLAFEVSLSLNFESIITAVIAALFFKEHLNRKVVLGILTIALGGMILALPHHLNAWRFSAATVWTVIACLGWSLDNNLTRQLSENDPIFLAMMKGIVAGAVNLIIAFIWTPHAGVTSENLPIIGEAMALGMFCQGVSLVCFILALRNLGASRTLAYFSTSSFIGALAAYFFLGEKVFVSHGVVFALMALGIWLMATEKHGHEHTHEALEHDHWHAHDEHHQHDHEAGQEAKGHSHPHRHDPSTHTHSHTPDLHHQHTHS